jgi:leucyl aminopeptidase
LTNTKQKKEHRIEEIYVTQDSPHLEQTKYIADAMNFTRDLANEPAAYATPSKLADIAQSIEGVETRVFEKEQIKQMGMGAFYAVARGSEEPPKFIHMKYTSPTPLKKIAIIGKGLCFDSGGLDLKPASSMLTMRDDMSGAACVLGIMKVLNKFKPDIEVHGIIAACENMPGCDAYKPGDILTAKNGKTIEVDNTDAEGRLTLADALCYACELGVDEVIDIATLTGACMVALGSIASGVMGNDEDMIRKVIDTAKESGEKYWELPMFEEYMNGLKSDIADMKNIGGRNAGSATAACFLNRFVEKNTKWAHIDIAGMDLTDGSKAMYPKGASGFGVLLLNKFMEKI